ncbi:hypothetical protein [Pseudomonas capsici]|uniref:Uncharacterized protein n=1 Tax=Pseudomonas capsici TaxID=2810614 RepID=A0ABT3C448_9PSED|nr:hypothetical protein [Pseudomonas capsici]MBN6717188.1 hypothetical protein [Pseudomonas capsici]MBN6722252.1 hypothetical protein [Pseudomonas capsici]MBN6727150.1 hypothetical protein [Pseudomonas capsici]MCV4270867.1 hypothetical protein [Pseudomonas capsici]MCV4281017.1 hypothetical protein [Pseudomonas capsici]
MSNQAQEKENSLAELMARILKEPLKPLDESVKGLKDELADIKDEIEHTKNSVVSGVVEVLNKHERSAKNRDEDMLEALRTSISEQAQALAAMPGHVGEALAGSVTSLPEQLHKQQASLAGMLAEWQTHASATHTEQAASINTAVAGISQRLEQQQKGAQAAQLALLGALKGAAEHSQSAMAKTQQDGQTLRELFAAGQAEVLGALSEQAQVFNTRLDQSQAKIRQLTIIIGVFFVSMLAYVVYDVLGRV